MQVRCSGGNFRIRIFSFAFLMVCNSVLLFSQQIFDTFQPKVDTNYVGLENNNWSIRLAGVFKYQNFLISDLGGNKAKFLPNDRTSVGVGFAYRFLAVDINFRLKLNPEEFTRRFDLQGELAFQKHLFHVFVQRYEGFREVDVPEPLFRGDIRSWVGGLNYFYNLNHRRLSIQSVLTGNRIQKKSVGGFLVGGYFSTSDLKADSSIVRTVNNNGNIQGFDRSKMHSFGISSGYAFTWVLPENFFIFGGLMPGLGFSFGERKNNFDEKIPVDLSGKAHIRAAVGNISGRFYSGLLYTTDYFVIDTGRENLFRYNVGMIKLVIGYKLSVKNTFMKDIIP